MWKHYECENLTPIEDNIWDFNAMCFCCHILRCFVFLSPSSGVSSKYRKENAWHVPCSKSLWLWQATPTPGSQHVSTGTMQPACLAFSCNLSKGSMPSCYNFRGCASTILINFTFGHFSRMLCNKYTTQQIFFVIHLNSWHQRIQENFCRNNFVTLWMVYFVNCHKHCLCVKMQIYISLFNIFLSFILNHPHPQNPNKNPRKISGCYSLRRANTQVDHNR